MPITRGGTTLSFGDSPGQALRPTVAQLRQMNVGIEGASDVGSYKSLTQGGYSITINLNRTPAGCETSPSGVDCNITGLVCTDRPVQDFGAPAGIVCARFGFGVAEYWSFLRVRDSRDPNFMNNVTLKGGLHVKSTATYGATCPTNGMAMWGNFAGNQPGMAAMQGW